MSEEVNTVIDGLKEDRAVAMTSKKALMTSTSEGGEAYTNFSDARAVLMGDSTLSDTSCGIWDALAVMAMEKELLDGTESGETSYQIGVASPYRTQTDISSTITTFTVTADSAIGSWRTWLVSEPTDRTKATGYLADVLTTYDSTHDFYDSDSDMDLNTSANLLVNLMSNSETTVWSRAYSVLSSHYSGTEGNVMKLIVTDESTGDVTYTYSYDASWFYWLYWVQNRITAEMTLQSYTDTAVSTWYSDYIISKGMDSGLFTVPTLTDADSTALETAYEAIQTALDALSNYSDNLDDDHYQSVVTTIDDALGGDSSAVALALSGRRASLLAQLEDTPIASKSIRALFRTFVKALVDRPTSYLVDFNGCIDTITSLQSTIAKKDSTLSELYTDTTLWMETPTVYSLYRDADTHLQIAYSAYPCYTGMALRYAKFDSFDDVLGYLTGTTPTWTEINAVTGYDASKGRICYLDCEAVQTMETALGTSGYGVVSVRTTDTDTDLQVDSAYTSKSDWSDNLSDSFTGTLTVSSDSIVFTNKDDVSAGQYLLIDDCLYYVKVKSGERDYTLTLKAGTSPSEGSSEVTAYTVQGMLSLSE